MSSDAYNLWTVVIYSISALIALIMLGVATWQLRKLALQVKAANEANALNQIGVLLNLEQQLAERRRLLSERGAYITSLASETDSAKLNAATLTFNEAKESYLNVLDRLAFCILKSLLPDNDMRLEYRDIFKAALTDFNEFFGRDTPYRNIVRVYEKWADQ